jgi:DNA-binding NarL/FixJ family response regulator
MAQADLSTFVLVVADKLALRGELMAGLVAIPTLRVTMAVSLTEALAALQTAERRIDLMILDLGLSAGGAVTLARKLRDPLAFGSRNIPILLVGEPMSPQILQANLRLGVQGHLPGSPALDRLRVAVRDALLAAPQKAKPRAPVAKAAPAPEPPKAPYAEPADIPHANKPFRHGLQTPMPPRKPLSDDDGFGFDAPQLSIKPRRIRTTDDLPDVSVFVSRRRAVA